MDNLLDFNNCAVFVAGGSSGINLGIADAFASRGAKVAVTGRPRCCGHLDSARMRRRLARSRSDGDLDIIENMVLGIDENEQVDLTGAGEGQRHVE